MRIISYLLVLIVVIYAALIIVPGRDHQGVELAEEDRTLTRGFFANILSAAEEEATTPPADGRVIVARQEQLLASGALVEDDDGTLRLQTAEGEWIEIAAVINPTDLIADVPVAAPIQTVAVGEEPVEDGAEGVVVQAPAPILWQVSGTRVNFRAGPTTNAAILTALVQGDLVEFLGDGPDGWAHLRVPSTGLEGYMSVDFLVPAN